MLDALYMFNQSSGQCARVVFARIVQSNPVLLRTKHTLAKEASRTHAGVSAQMPCDDYVMRSWAPRFIRCENARGLESTVGTLFLEVKNREDFRLEYMRNGFLFHVLSVGPEASAMQEVDVVRPSAGPHVPSG